MGTSFSKLCPCLNWEKVVIEEVEDFKEDVKQYDFDGLIHDGLATSIRYRYMMGNRNYSNV